MPSVAPDSRPKVVIVTGPTATGKTAVAIEIAQRFAGEIVNADSMQVFRFMDIGTAKATPEQRALVPHHLLDVVTPDVPYSAGRYSQEARAAADTILGRGRLPLVTGGTGLYIRAFLEGLIASGDVDPELRERIEAQQAEAVREGDPHRLHRRLAKIDPDAGKAIHPNDARRVTRALEIAETFNAPSSQVREAHGFEDRPYHALHLALDLDRDTLNAHIDARCRAMVEQGLLQEVRDLRERGYGPELRPMKSIGYRHMMPVVDGADTLASALVTMQTDTRRFARRQRTWLRPLADVEWFDPRNPNEILHRVEQFLEA
jgi:tRNA dimethylallyltransferase